MLRPSIRILTAAALFAVAWLAWSGHYSGQLLTLGAAACVLVLCLAVRTGFFELEVYALHLGPQLPRYWFWLLKEIVRSNFAVARIILSRRIQIEPTLTRLDVSRLPVVAQATLANSITLTPGSLSLDVDRGYIEVHCLNPRIAAQLQRGEMVRRAAELTGS